MSECQVTIQQEMLSNLLTGSKEGMAELISNILNQVLNAQAEEQLCAARHERTENRAG